MGMARATKGGERLAAIAFHLFAERPDVRFFIQCPRPSAAEYFRNILKKANCERELDISLKMSSDQYYEQVARSDLILLPYFAQVYAFQSSGVFSDAVGAGVPVVVPADTWMSDRLNEGFGAGIAFSDESPKAIAKAIVAALDALPRLKASAASSAARWREAHSAQRYLEFVLKTVGDVEAVGR
jgi:glycosyltransferase involved in cell wall biosynthesis